MRRAELARAQIRAARDYWELAKACARLPIEATYYRARAGAALYNARQLLTPRPSPRKIPC